LDSGLSGQVEYRLIDHPTSDQFSIDPVTGRLFTVALLDREMVIVIVITTIPIAASSL